MMTPSVTECSAASRRGWVDVHGKIVAAETVRIGSSRGYRCVLDDGTWQLDLLFLGQTTVRGLGVGVGCRVCGRVALHQGRPAIWNPRWPTG